MLNLQGNTIKYYIYKYIYMTNNFIFKYSITNFEEVKDQIDLDI